MIRNFMNYSIYCEIETIERFKRIEDALSDRGYMFKFNGEKYAVFSLEDGTQFTDWKLTIAELEKFAEERNGGVTS